MEFISHHKCASGWLADILYSYFVLRHQKPAFHSARGDEYPSNPDSFVYLMFANGNWHYLKSRVRRAIHIIRNPLAVIVSSYFSHLKTHPLDGWKQLECQREKIRGVDFLKGIELTEEFLCNPSFFDGTPGPLMAMGEFDFECERMMTVRMEDLVAYPEPHFRRMFKFLDVTIGDDFWETLPSHSFEAKAGGRLPGQVDFNSHYRSGNPYDWANHLPFSQAKLFYKKHCNLVDRFYPEVARLFIDS